MKILGVKLTTQTKEELLNDLSYPAKIFTPNPEILLKAHANTAYKKTLNKADYSLPDGNGLLYVSTLFRLESKILRWLFAAPLLLLFLFNKSFFKKEIPEVIHGSDFMFELVKKAAKEGQSVFFLGAKPGVAAQCAQVFKEKFPNLKIAGHSSKNPDDPLALTDVIQSNADFLFVAYGAPKQEQWITEHFESIHNLKLAMGVGGSFDFWSGNIKRAPLFFQKMGLEWLWRLMREPRRIKRIINALIIFPIICLSSPSSQPVQHSE